MQIPSSFLDLLRSRTSLAELIGTKVKLTRKGRIFKGLCPFHQEKTPSFTVDEERESYHCFGCGAHGDGIRFLMEAQNYTFMEAVRELAGRAGLALPAANLDSHVETLAEDLAPLKSALQEANAWFQRNLSQAQGGGALHYTEKRSLTRETLKVFGMGYASEARHNLENHLKGKGFSIETLVKAGLVVQEEDSHKVHDRFRGRLMFPIQDARGQVVGFGGRLLTAGEPKYLNSPETPLFSKGKLLYGYPFAKEKARTAPLLIVEGYMDVISLHQAGFKGAVAPLGTALTEEQILLAWRLSPEPILCFDGDTAGLKAAMRAAERVLPLLKPGYSLQFVFLPEGEDPDSFVKKRTAFDALLTKATPLLEALWIFLTHGKSFKTPEHKAALQKQCAVWVNTITHTDIKKHYHYALKELFYKDFIQKKVTRTPVAALKRAPLNFISIHERLLLAILINHPTLLNEISDELSLVDFQEAFLRDIRDSILAFYADSSRDLSLMKDHLLSSGFKAEVDVILSPQILIHGAFSHANASEKQAHAGWREIFGRTQAASGARDISLAQSHLAEEMTENAWQRLKMLKKSMLLND